MSPPPWVDPAPRDLVDAMVDIIAKAHRREPDEGDLRAATALLLSGLVVRAPRPGGAT